MSRASRFLQGLGANYALFVVTAVCGLYLTRLILARVGQEQYGNWLVLLQLLGYLDLLDLGVVAVLPREVAAGTGKAGAEGRLSAAAGVVRRAWAVVWVQAPIAALAAVGFWWLASNTADGFAQPAALVAVVYVALFPLRVFPAALIGLQDLGFSGWVNLATWLMQFALSVGLILAGYGAWALVLAWVAHRLAGTAVAWLRFRWLTAGAGADPSADPGARRLLVSGLWVSLSRVSQGLLNGTEIILLGKLLGPDPVVVYACTSKLVSMFSPQLYSIITTAEPGISELRHSGDRQRLAKVSRSLGLLMLLCSGLVASVVLATNEGFVAWWVGEGRFGGPALTWLLVATMVLRHLAFTLLHLLYCMGHERALAVLGLIDGALCVGAASGLIAWLGLEGAALGSLVSVVVCTLPVGLTLLGRELGVSPLALLLGYWPWLWRFGLAAATITAAVAYHPPAGFVELAAATLLATAVYAALVFPVLKRSPLWAMAAPRLAALWGRLRPGAGPVVTDRAEHDVAGSRSL